MTRLTVGDRVESEFGVGTVTAHTDRSVTVAYDDGTTINTVTGSYGYDRIVKVTR